VTDLLGSETFRAVAVAFLALGGALGWMSLRATRIPVGSPERLVAEFRVLRFAALLLALTAGTAIGIAAAREQIPAGALEVSLAIGFFVLAAVALTKDPAQALTMLAAGFAAHALLDIAHRPGLLSPDLAPRWFYVSCAVYDVAVGALCYLPLFRR
jgi:hypothetical protein